MKTRRHFLATLAASVLSLAAGGAMATQPTVEILAMPHPPVQMALKPLRDWLAAQGGKIKVSQVDIESPQGTKLLTSVGLNGHIPILILIDGQYRHRRKDGKPLAFVNFPAIPEAPSGVRGEWTTADVEAVLMERMK